MSNKNETELSKIDNLQLEIEKLKERWDETTDIFVEDIENIKKQLKGQSKHNKSDIPIEDIERAVKAVKSNGPQPGDLMWDKRQGNLFQVKKVVDSDVQDTAGIWHIGQQEFVQLDETNVGQIMMDKIRQAMEELAGVCDYSLQVSAAFRHLVDAINYNYNRVQIKRINK